MGAKGSTDMHRYLRVYLLGALALAMIHLVGFVGFVLDPAVHYYRPWEYFDEIAYRTPAVPASWDRPEAGDLTRHHLVFYQESRRTRVTADGDGFRANPARPGPYRIVVAGDSSVFGSGLSDDETLSWRLAERTGAATFNAGRTTLWNALLRPDLQQVELVVDCVTERVLHKVGGVERPRAYQPIAPNDTPLWRVLLEVPPQRYSLPYKAPFLARRAARDALELFRGGRRERIILAYRVDESQLDDMVDRIVERAREVEARGMGYLFVAIPSKQTVHDPEVGGLTAELIPRLAAALAGRAVRMVDLRSAFLEHGSEDLFHPYDTHWSAAGADLAARRIAEEIAAARH